MQAGINNIHCGNRKYHSLTDHVILLESNIRQVFVQEEHVLSIIFDVKKANDSTWKYGITKKFHRRGLTGFLPRFIPIYFRIVRLGISSAAMCRHPIPRKWASLRGSVLSVTLLYPLDQSASGDPLPWRNLLSLQYEDDLQISYRHTCLRTIEHELQKCLDLVGKWVSLNGLRYSFPVWTYNKP